ncbi:MAG: SpoVG family protein [Clostridiales bacterium]|nr:SpoVG family protein [Clostridiales bacterium]
MAKKANIKDKINEPEILATVDRLIDREDSKVKAMLSVKIGDSFAVHGVKVIDSKNGLFVQMPQREYNDNGVTKYADLFLPITAEARTKINDEVFRAFDEKLQETEGFVDEMSDELPFNQPGQTMQ